MKRGLKIKTRSGKLIHIKMVVIVAHRSHALTFNGIDSYAHIKTPLEIEMGDKSRTWWNKNVKFKIYKMSLGDFSFFLFFFHCFTVILYLVSAFGLFSSTLSLTCALFFWVGRRSVTFHVKVIRMKIFPHLPFLSHAMLSHEISFSHLFCCFHS